MYLIHFAICVLCLSSVCVCVVCMCVCVPMGEGGTDAHICSIQRTTLIAPQVPSTLLFETGFLHSSSVLICPGLVASEFQESAYLYLHSVRQDSSMC